MVHIADLPVKLGLLLQAISLSRVGLAQKMGVDKSLVGRWLAGKVHPSEHNLARLAAIGAEAVPGLRLADFHGATDALASKLGLEWPQGASELAISQNSPLAAFLDAGRAELAHRGAAYEGFWRTSRPSLLVSERIFHDYGMLRRGPGGLIEVTIQGSGLDFNGWAFPMVGSLFIFLFDGTGRTPVSLLFKGVSLPRATVLDGMLMMAALDSNRTPVSMPIVAERVADLTGDEGDDIALFRNIVERSVEPEQGLAQGDLESRLYRDVGPDAVAAGGDPFFLVDAAHGLSRGSAGSGLQG